MRSAKLALRIPAAWIVRKRKQAEVRTRHVGQDRQWLQAPRQPIRSASIWRKPIRGRSQSIGVRNQKVHMHCFLRLPTVTKTPPFDSLCVPAGRSHCVPCRVTFVFRPDWSLMTETSIRESEVPAGNRLIADRGSAAPLPALPLAMTGRGLAVAVFAAVAELFALDLAQSFVISLLLGILFACTLNPLVVWLSTVPRPACSGWLN